MAIGAAWFWLNKRTVVARGAAFTYGIVSFTSLLAQVVLIHFDTRKSFSLSTMASIVLSDNLLMKLPESSAHEAILPHLSRRYGLYCTIESITEH